MNISYKKLHSLPSYVEKIENIEEIRQLDSYTIITYKQDVKHGVVKIYEFEQKCEGMKKYLEKIIDKYKLDISRSEYKYEFQFAKLIISALDAQYL